MLNLKQVTLRRGGQVLLTGVNLTVHAGQKLGVVGRNGSGKSSLFALLAGKLSADAGAVQIPAGLAIAQVAQENPSGSRAAIEQVLDGDHELRHIQAALEQAEMRADGAAQAQLHERMEGIGGYAARARAGRLMHGLGFAPESHDAPIDSFSGGWRMRLNLAQALMCRADLLLLDEPTNHLDLDAVLWLQEHLARYPGTLMAISHDRDFLDAATAHTLHLHDGRASLYTGGYSAFERQRAAQLVQQQAAYENQRKRLEHMQAFVERFRAKATKARQAQSRLKQIERMDVVEPAYWETPFTFDFGAPRRLPAWLLRADDADAGYGTAPVVAGLNLILTPGERIGLLGRNGAGKTTVMRLLAGELAPRKGDLQRDRYLQVGYFAQHQVEQLDPNASALEHLRRLDPGAREAELRNYLGGFDFAGNAALTPIAPFSGGEKARLALACVVWRRPNLLLLDEPTNHLDLDMRHALEIALHDYPGAVVLVSHDRHLVNATCDALWRVGGGSCAPFDGDLDDYAAWLRRSLAPGARQPRPGADQTAAPSPSPSASAKAKRQHAAARRQQEQPLRRKLKTLERELAALQAELNTVEARLADPLLYHAEALNGGDDGVAGLTAAQGQLRKRIETAEERWLAAAEALEGGEAARQRTAG